MLSRIKVLPLFFGCFYLWLLLTWWLVDGKFTPIGSWGMLYSWELNQGHCAKKELLYYLYHFYEPLEFIEGHGIWGHTQKFTVKLLKSMRSCSKFAAWGGNFPTVFGKSYGTKDQNRAFNFWGMLTSLFS